MSTPTKSLQFPVLDHGYGAVTAVEANKRIGKLEAEVKAQIVINRQLEKKHRWISVKERLPEGKSTRHEYLVWIKNGNEQRGYRDIAAYGDYVCQDESIRPGDPTYIEGNDDGNRSGSGWYREEETRGGEYDYIYLDLNSTVTHWQPLPAPPEADPC